MTQVVQRFDISKYCSMFGMIGRSVVFIGRSVVFKNPLSLACVRNSPPLVENVYNNINVGNGWYGGGELVVSELNGGKSI